MRDSVFWRWAILLSYCFITASSQMIWLEFSGIAVPQMILIFHVNLLMIGLMVSIWPLISIPLALISGVLADRLGYRFTISLGGSIIALFSWLRLIAGKDFTLLLLFQSLAGIGQTFIYDSVTKLVGELFPINEQALANGVGAMSEILGMALALVISPLLVPTPSYNYLMINIIVYSLISTISLITFIIIGKTTYVNTHSGYEISTNISMRDIMSIMRMRTIVILMILFFVGTGIFAALTQWIEPILYSRNIPQIYSDLAGMVMLISGSLGMILIPYIYGKLHTRSLFTINTSILTLLLILFSIRLQYPILYFIIAALIGFLLLSLAPLGLQLSLEIVGTKITGTTTGLLGLMSEAGAFLMVIIIGEIYSTTESQFKGNPWFIPIIVMSLLSLVLSILSLLIVIDRDQSSFRT
ncbi:MFS transporter [Vulcanisaeta moutnovskia]|uniref:MFS transporter n=1 Tax=Vulcanisaeta moutnovskia TaxID=985052 RepID=UPI0013053F9D|nr:MFS transporter [Vulcanisaeta moutnovskia]